MLFVIGLIPTSLREVSAQNVDSLRTVFNDPSSPDTSRVDAANHLGYALLVQGDTTLLEYLGKADSLANKIGYKKGKGDAYHVYGMYYYYYPTDYKKAAEYYEKSLQLRIEIKDEDAQARSHLNLGNTRWRLQEYEKALNDFLAALKYYETKKNKADEADIFNNIGLIYLDQKIYSKAAKHFDNAREIYKTTDDHKRLGGVYANLGTVYNLTHKLDSAEYCFIQSRKEYAEINDQNGNAISSTNLGEVYLKKEEYDKAIENFEMGVATAKKEGFDYLLNSANLGLGSAYLKVGRANEAIPLLLKAKTAIELSNSNNNLDVAYELLADAYSQTGNYKEALNYHVKYSDVKDSVANKNSTDRLAEMEAKFENHKQEKENLIQKAQLAEQQVTIQTGKMQRNLFILAGIALLIVIVIVYRSYRRKKQSNELLAEQKLQILEANEELNQTNEEIMAQRDQIESQKMIVEEKNASITASINYAQRIQRALLHDENQTNTDLPDHFILFKPRDIVSGDFYWNKRIGDYWYVACADCTGHGVPGAFMSMLGVAYLNEITGGQEVLEPSVILNKLRDKVILELAQKGRMEDSKDGMDIALIRYNFKTQELQYSGAHNPLYFIQNGELEVIKATKRPIGYFRKMKDFENHSITLDSDTTAYLFSDGYADQFGGPEDGKFGYRQLKDLLVNNYQNPLDAQKQLLSDRFEAWKSQGSDGQIDDVCLIGIQFKI